MGYPRPSGGDFPAVGMEDTTAAVFTFAQPPWALPKDEALTGYLPKGRKRRWRHWAWRRCSRRISTRCGTSRRRNLSGSSCGGALRARRVLRLHYRRQIGGGGMRPLLTELCARLGIEAVTVGAVLVGRSVPAVSGAALKRRSPGSGLPAKPLHPGFSRGGGRSETRPAAGHPYHQSAAAAPLCSSPLPGVYASSVEVEGGTAFHQGCAHRGGTIVGGNLIPRFQRRFYGAGSGFIGQLPAP